MPGISAAAVPRSVEVKAKSVGEEHPALAAAYLNLGTLEGARKHWARVEEYTLKAHVIYKVLETAFPFSTACVYPCR